MPPLVSICIPVLDGERLIARAIRSALAQDYPDVEIVVVDDASQDATLRLVREEFGDQVRLFRRATRSGQGRTMNAAIALSRGKYVKFLHHDDVLERNCVPAMTAALERHKSAGMVFCRRMLERGGGDASDAWEERYRDVHRGFKDLQELNAGEELFRQLIGDELHHNWIGEPVCVMVRRESLVEIGGFGLHVRGSIDLGLWLRVAARYDIAFIDDELVTYRHSPSSHIKQARARGEAWLDRLWMLEMLCSDADVVRRHPELAGLRRRERRMALRTAAACVIGHQDPHLQLSIWREYEWFRMRRIVSHPPLVGSLATAAEGTIPVNTRATMAAV